MRNLADDFLEIERKTLEYNHVISLLYYDELTSQEKKCLSAKSKAMSFFTGLRHELQVGEQTNLLIQRLLQKIDELPEEIQKKVTFWNRNYEFEKSIDKQTFSEYMETIHTTEMLWRTAKKRNDFALVRDNYDRILKYQIDFANNYNHVLNPYDVILNRYEPGIDQTMYDFFFSRIKKELIPLIKEINLINKKKEKFPVFYTMNLEKQEKVSQLLMKVLGLYPYFCSIGETEHPFTIKLCRNDIRITTRYEVGDFLSSFFTVLHEGGHALYEHSMDDVFNGSCLCEAASMGMHESQSRFYENQLGRNRFFLDYITTRLNNDLKYSCDIDGLYSAANQVFPSAIRTEADELTYPIHILIRYEIEKDLFAGNIKMSEAPYVWREKYNNYLGVRVDDDKTGILQDSHWSGGSLGYFPSYFIGSAYAAQFMNTIEKELNIPDLFSSGNIKPVTEWLKSRVHSIGPLLKPPQIIKQVCGEEFSVDYYIHYLLKKYRSIYDI